MVHILKSAGQFTSSTVILQKTLAKFLTNDLNLMDYSCFLTGETFVSSGPNPVWCPSIIYPDALNQVEVANKWTV